jgi:hypothetical protein
MAKFLVKETVIGHKPDETYRVAAGTGSANAYTDKEVGKFVKLAAESRYALAAAGDPIEGLIVAMEKATLDDFTIGTVRRGGRKEVTFDGDQATPGTGTVAVGDYVVVGTVVAKDTALTVGVPARVTKATIQPGVTEAGAVGDVNEHIKLVLNPWRVVSLGAAGTGAVDTVGIIERVGASV